MDNKIKLHGIEEQGRFYGVYYGVVKGISDPLNANRILVNVPEVFNNEKIVRIALPRFGVMGPGYGSHFLPKKNALVLVTFRQGDADYPFWEPAPWVDDQRPPELDTPDKFGFKSRTGHIVVIDDENNYITVQHKDGYYIEIKEDQVTIGEKIRTVIADDSIKLGDVDSLKYAILGDNLKDWLSDLADILREFKTLQGDVVNPETVSKIEALKTQLPKILAKF